MSFRPATDDRSVKATATLRRTYSLKVLLLGRLLVRGLLLGARGVGAMRPVSGGAAPGGF